MLALAGLAAGCAKNAASSTAGASPSPTVAPKQALLASTKTLVTSSYRFTIKSADANGSGAVDPANKAASATVTGQANNVSMKLDFIQIGADLYAKLDLGPLNSQLGISSDKYFHADVSKLTARTNLPFGLGGQPVDANGLLAGITNVQTTDGTHFTGTVDATKMTGVDAPNSDAVQKAGDKAKAIPFTATLDDQGRLTDLTINGNSIDPQFALEVTISDYGSAVGITKPDASQVVEAPDAVLKIFQG